MCAINCKYWKSNRVKNRLNKQIDDTINLPLSCLGRHITFTIILSPSGLFLRFGCPDMLFCMSIGCKNISIFDFMVEKE